MPPRIIPFADRHEAARGYATILGEANRHSPQAVTAAMAALGRADLFFMLTRFMRRADADNGWCFDRCKEVAANPDGYLDLWAREHYKSTIITVALTIQDILNDPEITVGLFSHTRPNSKVFLGQIKREFEANEVMKQCYPDVLYARPEVESPVWSLDDGIMVKRQNNAKEMTVEAWGVVEGQPIGRHFSLTVYDDVVTPESVNTPEQIKKTTERLRLSYALGAEGGTRRMIGTRYHLFDTYAELLKGGSVKPRIYAATEDGTMEGTPRFLSPQRLAEKRIEFGPYIFACQMLQNPTADSAQGFKAEWLRYWQSQKDHWQGMNRAILVDPASSKKKSSDYTVMAVVGWNADGCLYLIHGLRARLNLTERTKRLFDLVRQYKPVCTYYEKYGMQSDIEHIEDVMKRDNFHFNIKEVGGSTAKVDRIRRLIPWFEQGRFYLPIVSNFVDEDGVVRNFTPIFVEEEYDSFPVCAHDDMFDCIARAADPQVDMEFPESVDSRTPVEKELARQYESQRLMSEQASGNTFGLLYGYNPEGPQW
ncbi:hypothetical protein [Desulfovibrio intestinalis]|uniref:Phage terminase large subunit-like protein n=1 Tax=Desulfovibrio intestinalis TaxID=58621 RepID=A0A7W8FEM1_9BACT|nr:hypothetical protein [Desulfovibrio intestinalis]MBB5143944.1 phage terminase large subunit-like protein [Desulfovibrio intestinalis]